MSSPADRPDLLRLLAQKIFGEQARLFPWEEQRRPELPPSNRPATLSPAQRERPSDLRDMDMGELGRWIAEQEAAQEAGAAEAVHNMPASPVAGLVAALSPDTYANMAETEGPGGEAPTMAAALTGLETTGGPGHPLTPRMEGPTAPGGRKAPTKITGIPLPDPRMKGMPIDHLKNEHTARWWDKFEKAVEQGPVALEKARAEAQKDWDTRFKTWQVSNEPPQQGIVDQDFVIPSEGSAAGVEPTMFQPAKAPRPAKAEPALKPEKPQFIDRSAVSMVAEPMPEPPPTPPGGITVDAIEGKPGAWKIRDPKSGLEQEFIGDRETADKHAKWLAQLSLRNEAREKLKAAKAAEKPKPAEPPKAEEPPAEPAPRPDLAPNNPERDAAEALVRRTAELQKKQLEGTATPEEIAEINANIESNRTANRARMAPEKPLTDAEAAKLIEESNKPAPGFEQDPTPERVAEMMGEPAPPAAKPTTGPAADKPASVAAINKEMEAAGRSERLFRSPSGYYYWSGGKSGMGDGAWESIPMYRISDLPMSRVRSEIIEPNIKLSPADAPAERPRFAVGDEAWVNGNKTTILEVLPDGSYMIDAINPAGKPSRQLGNNLETRDERMLGRTAADKARRGPAPMTTGGGSLAPQGLPPTRGQKKPKYSPDTPVVGRRSSKPAKPAAKLTVPEPPPGPPGETALNQTLGLKYTPPKDGGVRTEKDYAGRPHTIEPWTGIEPSQKKQMLKNKDLFDRILAGMPYKESEFPRHLRGARKGDGPLEGPSVQEYLKALGKDVEDVNPASINWNQYNARQNSEPGSRVGLKPKPEPAPASEPPAEPVNENVPNKAGTVSGKKAPGQTGKKFSKPAAPSKYKPLLYAKEDRDRATKFEHFRVNAGDDINTEYNVPQGRWVVIGTNAAGETVYIDQFATGPQARDLAESHTANIGKRKK